MFYIGNRATDDDEFRIAAIKVASEAAYQSIKDVEQSIIKIAEKTIEIAEDMAAQAYDAATSTNTEDAQKSYETANKVVERAKNSIEFYKNTLTTSRDFKEEVEFALQHKRLSDVENAINTINIIVEKPMYKIIEKTRKVIIDLEPDSDSLY